MRLRKAVSKVQQDMNWQPKDHVRLVFHASFKRFNQNEINAVKTLMAELGDYEVEYAFLQLSEEHPVLDFRHKPEWRRRLRDQAEQGRVCPASRVDSAAL